MKKTTPRLLTLSVIGAALVLGPLSRAANILVVETNLDRVAQYSSTGTLISSNLLSGLASAGGIAVDGSGNIYVGSQSNNTIAEYNAAGTRINTISASINGPSGIAVDASNNLWVTNTLGNTVTEYNSSGTLIHTTTGLNLPTAIAFDTGGNAFVAEFSDTIAKLNSSTGAITNATYISSAALNNPQGVVTDGSGDLFVSNGATGANSVLEYNSSGTLIKTLTSSLTTPAGLLIDSAGDLLVANSGTGATGTVSEFNSSGTLLIGSFISATGTPQFTYMAFQPVSVPEPSRAALLLAGLSAAGSRRRPEASNQFHH